MHGFSKKMHCEGSYKRESDPFFAYRGGYRMQLHVVTGYPTGCNHVSLYLYQMSSPNDDELNPPQVIGTFKIDLLDQSNNDSYTRYISFDKDIPKIADVIQEYWSSPQHIYLDTIGHGNYIKNDSLTIMISYQHSSSSSS